jgi:hypothetical protein
VTILKTNDQLEPTVFIIFGGAGDLTWRKLVPALFDLSQDRSMAADFAIIVVDRVDTSDEKLRRRLRDGVKKFSRHGMMRTAEWGSSPGISTIGRAISRSSKLIRPWAKMRGAGKGMGRQNLSHLLHGHTAEHVRRDPEVPRQGRIGV